MLNQSTDIVFKSLMNKFLALLLLSPIVVSNEIGYKDYQCGKGFKALDIKHSLHSLRHTHASNMLSNNYPVTQLAHRLGHADPSITLSIYSHVVKGMEIDVNNYMPNIALKQVK